jgi:Family of unknown function (DUF5684)
MAAAYSSSVDVVLVLYLAVVVFDVAAGWKVFVKAGEPGWGIFGPIYNFYVICKIAGRPEWWLILFFVPLVNAVIGRIIALTSSSQSVDVAATGALVDNWQWNELDA